MKTRSLAFALGLTLLAGCATLPPFLQPAPQALVVNGDATLQLKPEVVPGGYAGQATVNPHSAASIDHVTLTVFKLDGSTEIPLMNSQGNPLAVTISQAQLGQEVRITKLWRHMTYRIKARAYADAAETQLISTAGASDQIDVVVTDDDRPAVARITLTLSDKVFNGTATTSVTFSAGTLLSSGTPTLTAPTLVSTFAGSGALGSTDGTGTAAQFRNPAGVAFDSAGNLYVAEANSHRIRKITPAGVVTTFAGSTQGYKDDTGTAAQFDTPLGIAIDAADNLYVTDFNNHRIRKITPAGVVSTFAGSAQGFQNGTGTGAWFKTPRSIVIDDADNLFVSDSGNNRIRKITPSGVVTTFAGSTQGYKDDTGTGAQFSQGAGLVFDAAGNLYVADNNNHRIRKITPAGVVTTVAGSAMGYKDGTGTAAQFRNPLGITIDAAGNLYVADSSNHRIRQITPAGVVTTVAGSSSSFTDGNAAIAKFNLPFGIVMAASGHLVIGDYVNNRIRKIAI